MHNHTEIAFWAMQDHDESRDGRCIDDVLEAQQNLRRHFDARILSASLARGHGKSRKAGG